jgi:hypothetical protein
MAASGGSSWPALSQKKNELVIFTSPATSQLFHMSFSRTLIHAAGVVASGALAVSCGAVFAADGKDVNSAFVFIKPHANTPAAQALVKKTLASRGKIVEEGEIGAAEIDSRLLIDQHYYSIASKATLVKPADMPVPADKFEKAFGLPWAQALQEGSVYNALDACNVLGVDAMGLDKLWATAKKVRWAQSRAAVWPEGVQQLPLALAHSLPLPPTSYQSTPCRLSLGAASTAGSSACPARSPSTS